MEELVSGFSSPTIQVPQAQGTPPQFHGIGGQRMNLLLFDHLELVLHVPEKPIRLAEDVVLFYREESCTS